MAVFALMAGASANAEFDCGIIGDLSFQATKPLDQNIINMQVTVLSTR